METLENSRLQQILLENQLRYPLWRVDDLYKLLYQAALGNEHAAVDREHARFWLEKELANLELTPAESLLDPISSDGRIVRVHLRPFKERNLPASLLLEAFMSTPRVFHGLLQKLESDWRAAEEMSAAGVLHLDPVEIRNFFDRMREEGFPAVHHSSAYSRAYHPAYRVVAVDLLPPEWK